MATTQVTSLADLARRYEKVHRYSTLFTAQVVRRELTAPENLEKAVAWCKASGIRRVFLETFRGNYTADREVLIRARDRFRAEGFEVSGCVTTTGVGPRGVPERSDSFCFTAEETHQNLARIFTYTASLFDEIIIDDFLYCVCECPLCDAARKAHPNDAGGERDWQQYHTDLMLEVSEKYILAPARAANPKVRIIIKYPNWYEGFRGPGYDILRETKLYPAIWVGTETREPEDAHWGSIRQYAGFFIMRYFDDVGGEKTGGGWYDEIDTKVPAYLEQARQTILGGARETMLFNYGSLQRGQGKTDHEALVAEMPRLLALADAIHGKPIRGIAAPKPAIDQKDDARIFDYAGMIGLPLVPMLHIPEPGAGGKGKALLLTAHWANDPALPKAIAAHLKAGTTLLITDSLAAKLQGKVDLSRAIILPHGNEPVQLLAMDQPSLAALRGKILAPLGIAFDAPSRVGLYPFGDNLAAIENFNDTPAAIRLKLPGWRRAAVALSFGDADKPVIAATDATISLDLPPRSLVLLRRSAP